MLTSIKKIKSVTAALMALLFVMAISLGSCNTSQTGGEDDAGTTTEMESSEGGEHPSDNAEHPAESDSTDVADEHPSEHPDN